MSELTPTHLDTFFRQPIAIQLLKASSESLHRRLEPYLVWLYEQGLVPFRTDRDVRKPFPLPDSAQDFVEILRPVKKPNTCAGYLVDLRDFHAWIATQGLCIETLNRHNMERWLKSLSDRGLAPVTRTARICRARSYLRWLAERGMAVGDPDDLIRVSDLPKIPTCLPRPFPTEADRELQHRFRKCGTVYGQALFLMRRSGVRIGELVRLEPGCLRENLHGNIFMKVPLGKLDNERLVPLDDETTKILLSLQQQCPRNSRFLILPALVRNTVKQHLSDTLKASAADLDIPGPVVSHRLRHTYATELLNAGMPLIGIMKLLGHRSLHMTMRYAAVTQETVVKSYYAAIAKISPHYELPAANFIDEPSPDQMLRDVISYLRNISTAENQTKRLITRIHKIRHDIAKFTDKPSQH
ncbi:tyrosine-type recombinase/integrase [Myxococcota bacterium]